MRYAQFGKLSVQALPRGKVGTDKGPNNSYDARSQDGAFMLPSGVNELGALQGHLDAQKFGQMAV